MDSVLEPIFSVIEDQCSGGTKFEMRKTALQNKLTLNNYEGLPGVLGKKGTKGKYRREQGNMTPVLGNTGT